MTLLLKSLQCQFLYNFFDVQKLPLILLLYIMTREVIKQKLALINIKGTFLKRSFKTKIPIFWRFSQNLAALF